MTTHIFCRPLVPGSVRAANASLPRSEAIRDEYEASLKRARRDRQRIVHWIPDGGGDLRPVPWGEAFATERVAKTGSELELILSETAHKSEGKQAAAVELCGHVTADLIRDLAAYCSRSRIDFHVNPAGFALAIGDEQVRST